MRQANVKCSRFVLLETDVAKQRRAHLDKDARDTVHWMDTDQRLLAVAKQ